MQCDLGWLQAMPQKLGLIPGKLLIAGVGRGGPFVLAVGSFMVAHGVARSGISVATGNPFYLAFAH